MSSFILECDGPDGLLLIDRGNLSQLTREHVAAFDILLDRNGKTELCRDFPNETWSDVWNRESALVLEFLNSGKGFIALVGGGDHECKVTINNCNPASSPSCIYLPTGSLIAVSASEVIQCVSYTDLEMEIPFEKDVDPGWYGVLHDSQLSFQLSECAANRSCVNMLVLE